jgi:hypothetical protein
MRVVMTDARSIPRGLQAGLLAAGLAFQLSVVVYFALHFDAAILRLVPDDAFYYLKIAQNVANGFGSVFSVGEPTNGYHPLWLAILVVVHLVTQPTAEQFVIYAIGVAAIFNVVAAHAFWRLLVTLEFPPVAAVLGIVVYLFSPWLVNVTLTGLETPLFLWLLLVFLRLTEEWRRHRSVYTLRGALVFGTVSGLLMLARTDSILFTAPVFLALVWQRRESARALCVAGAVASLILLPWLAWNVITFGTIVQSSAVAMPVLRQAMLPSVLTADYWVQAWKIFEWTAYWAVLAPLVRHTAYSQQLEWWTGAFVVLLGLLAAVIFDRRVSGKRMRAPLTLLGPTILLLFYYCAFRSFVQIWNIAAAYVALLFIALDLVPENWPPLRSVTLGLVMLPLTGYSLSNGYLYPQMSTSIAATRNYAATALRPLRLCSTDSGMLGYFSRHSVVNLDGVVNNRALAAIRAGRFTEYTRAIGCDEVRVDTGRLVFYDRNLPRPCKATFEHGWYAREVSVDSWWTWSSGSGTIVVHTDRAGDWLLEAQVASAAVPNEVRYVLNGRDVRRQVVDWSGFRALPPAEIRLDAGRNTLQVLSSAPPRLLGTDTRRLAIAVRNLTLTQQTGSVTCDVATSSARAQ